MSGKGKTKGELTEEEKRKMEFVHNFKDNLLTELAQHTDWKIVMKTGQEIEKIMGNKFDDRPMSEIVLAMQFLVENFLCQMLTPVNREQIAFEPLKIMQRMSRKIQ